MDTDLAAEPQKTQSSSSPSVPHVTKGRTPVDKPLSLVLSVPTDCLQNSKRELVKTPSSPLSYSPTSVPSPHASPLPASMHSAHASPLSHRTMEHCKASENGQKSACSPVSQTDSPCGVEGSASRQVSSSSTVVARVSPAGGHRPRARVLSKSYEVSMGGEPPKCYSLQGGTV